MAPSTLAMAMVTTAARDQERKRTLASLGYNGIQIVKDRKRTALTNHLATWRTVFSRPHITHGLVLQDDIRAPRHWREVVDMFLYEFPDQPVMSFYSARKQAGGSADTVGGHFMLPGESWLNEQALLLRREVYVGFVRWLASEDYMRVLSPQDAKHHDVLLGTFLSSRGVKVLVCAPSLFQHSGVESTLGHPRTIGGRARQAQDWPGEQWDAATYFRRRLAPRGLVGATGRFRAL